ncbi:centrosomal protein of 19 kDa-like [Branchiostoma floridae x Branchiostoma belcheri]
MSRQYSLRKCGIRFDPPALFITYTDKSAGKTRCRTMPIRNFTKTSTVTRFVEDFRKNPRHKKFLENVPKSQLEKLLRLLQDNLRGMSLDESLNEIRKEYSIDPNEDLNKVDEETLRKKKTAMEDSFEKNRKKPGDPDFEYEVERDFQPVETCEWDSADSGSDADF